MLGTLAHALLRAASTLLSMHGSGKTGDGLVYPKPQFGAWTHLPLLKIAGCGSVPSPRLNRAATVRER